MPIEFVEEIIDEKEQQKEEEENNAVSDFVKKFIHTKFDKYISYDDLLMLKNTNLITTQSNILTNYIKNLISIVNGEKIYLYFNDVKIHYLLTGMNPDKFLQVFTIHFIETSINQLTQKQRDTLKNMNGKLSNDVREQIETDLRVDEKTFQNPKLEQIHFKNGYIHLKTLKFKQRKRTDYMTYCINRDFKPVKDSSKKIVMNLLKKIYPEENDRDCVCECFGESISGHSTKSQYNLFLLGEGSTGKSTIMKLCKIAFKEMVFELKEDTFAINNHKSDRVLNCLMYNPFIRLLWVNELKGKIDDSLYKQFVEGQIHTTTLFKEGQNTIFHHALLVCSMNNLPNIIMDSGVERRIKGLTHNSHFTDKKELVDENLNIYLKDESLIHKFNDDEDLQNAFVEILCEYACRFLKGERFKPSKNFVETKQGVVNTNDIVQDFINQYLTKTSNEKDKVSIDEMETWFKTHFPNSRITKQQLTGHLKDKGFKYSPDARIPNTSKRGCFVCVKINNQTDNNSFLDDNIDYAFGKSEEIKVLSDENKSLKKQIQELKSQLELALELKTVVVDDDNDEKTTNPKITTNPIPIPPKKENKYQFGKSTLTQKIVETKKTNKSTIEKTDTLQDKMKKVMKTPNLPAVSKQDLLTVLDGSNTNLLDKDGEDYSEEDLEKEFANIIKKI